MNQTSVPRRRSWPSLRSLSCSIVRCRRSSSAFGEVCRRATAECAVICCCFPLETAKVLVLAIYKIPAGICSRAISKVQQRKLRKKGSVEPCNRKGGCGCGCDDDRDFQIQTVERVDSSEESQKAVKELEKEMLKKFYGSGFWRSPSNCRWRR
ncbi:uncharacterized protein LOC120126218 [Hibiscus syriacus]|uniref:uncharacterized protein LOC120126218 n=1 Tax=Hibiscus syriacus TaxID=106335 RepID=UPI001924F77A|nr:uncharacterized protein LOC120126218 [Hibiscus syriacus]